MDKPDVDFIEGLSPAISIDQKSASRNPRSTVGTITEIYDYLRLLYARIGVPHCPNCGTVITRQTPQQIVDRVLQLEEGTRFQVLAPVVRGRKGEYETLLEDLASQGFVRARIDGEVVELGASTSDELARYEKHTIEVVVDRLVRRDGHRAAAHRLAGDGAALAEGVAEVEIVPREDDPSELETLTFCEHLACPDCGTSFDELAPRNFSFNSPYGACERATASARASRSTPSSSSPTTTSACATGRSPRGRVRAAEYFTRMLEAVADAIRHRPPTRRGRSSRRRTSRSSSTASRQDVLKVKYKNRYGRSASTPRSYEGVIPWIERRHEESESDWTASSSRATCARCRARRAAAPG